VVSENWVRLYLPCLFGLLITVGCTHLSFERAEDWERGAPARLYLPESIVRFDDTVSGDVVRQRIRLRNIGGSPLRISRTEASCGCTVVSIDRDVIPPNGTATLEILIDTTGKVGAVEKTVSIFSNDTVEPEARLTLKVRVKSPAHRGMSVEGVTIFHGECRRCHVDVGMGLSGERLFQADCAMCHRSKDDEYSPGPPIEVLRVIEMDALKRATTKGIPDSSMPGFSKAEGGPLTEEQIQSLLQFLRGNP